MPTKEIKSIIIILVLSFGTCTLVDKYIDVKKEIALKEMENKTLTDTQKNILYAMEKVQHGTKRLQKALYDENFDILEINGVEFTHEELHEKSKTTREIRPVEHKIYKGQFIITDIHFENDTVYIDVIDINNEKIITYINILSELISEDDYKWFKNSINRQAIDMTIISTEKQGKNIGSYLQSFKK